MNFSPHELTAYLNEIGRLPVLTREAQLRHCRRIHAWVHHPDGRLAAPRPIARAGQRSMDVMVSTNTRLVVSIAKKYANGGMEMLDLIQEGNLGLVRGLELYDPTRGYAFSTYAYWWIRQAITRALHTHVRPIRLPINTHEKLTRARRFTQEFQHLHGRAPTLPELAIELRVSEDRVERMLTSSSTTQCSSLDAIRRDGDATETVVQMIANPVETPCNSPEAALAVEAQAELLALAGDLLDDQELRVLRALFLEEKTMQTAADDLGITRTQVHTLRNRALRHLRRNLGEA